MKITERRLKSIIRSVIKESAGQMQSMDDVRERCKENIMNDIDDLIEDAVKDFILEEHSRDLDFANTSGQQVRDQMSPDSEFYKSELSSQRSEEDYDNVLRNMSPDLYEEIIEVCSTVTVGR